MTHAQKVAVNTHVATSIVVAGFLFSIYSLYAWGFWIGSIWVSEEYWNHTMQRSYSPGDILVVFWGVIFGLFALAAAPTNFKAITEGKIAGKFAFEVIDRKPLILQDDPNASEH